MTEYKLHKKIGVGLDKLDTMNIGLKWAFDQIRNEAKKNALAELTKLLQNKFDDSKREVLNKWQEWIKNSLLTKLFPFRQYFTNKILKKKLRQWKDTADEIKRLDDLEEERGNKIIELLKILIIHM